MPEEANRPPSPEERGFNKETDSRKLHRVRRETIQWVIRTGAAGAAAAALINLLIYLKDRHWQMLALAGFEVLAMLFLLPAIRLMRKGRTQAAGYWVLSSTALAFGLAELVHAGLTPYFLMGGVLIILIVGNILLPRQWGGWTIFVLSYLAFVLLVNWLEPLPRLDLAPLVGLRLFAILLVISLTGVAIWQMLQAYRHIETIRTRLLVSFVLVVGLPMAAIITASVIGGVRSGRERAFAQLESVATLKEAEVNAWLQTLQTDLNSLLGGQTEMENAIILLHEEDEENEIYRDAYNSLRGRFGEPVDRTGRFEQVFMLDANGRVIISTDPEQEGNNYRGYSFFQIGREEEQTHLTWEWGIWWLDTVRPVRDATGETIGVLVGRTDMALLNELMSERAGLGQTGETYIISAERAVLTDMDTEERILYMPEEGIYGTITRARQDDKALYQSYDGDPVVGVYHWLENFNAALIAEQTQSEALQATTAAIVVIALVGLGAIGVAVAVALLITRDIASPLIELAATATMVAEGDLTHTAQVVRNDEIGTLARAFNKMTTRLRDLISGLEQRVAERTHELEVRTGQLEAAAQIARETLAIRDLSELLDHTASLIAERFDFYHVGIFLLDSAKEYAVLMAANSEGGQRMLEREHRLPVGPVGIVGYVTHTGEPRITVGVSDDRIHLENPELPLTKSELALPLKAGEEIIGALDVQTTETAAFTEEDVKVLQILADQLAVAIQNSRLIAQTQQALNEVQNLHRQYLQTEWSRVTEEQGALVHEYTRTGVPKLTGSKDARPSEGPEGAHPGGENGNGNGHDLAAAKATLAVPIKLRDQVIGVIDIQETDEERQWSEDEVNLVQTISDQMAQTLENVRLFEDARIRAEELAVLNELGQSLAGALTVDDVLEQAFKGTSRLVSTENFYIALYDANTNTVTIPINVSKSQEDQRHTTLPADRGLTGHIIRTRKSLLVKENITQLLDELGIERVGGVASSWLGVPIMVGERVLGVMALQSYERTHAFNEHDEGLLIGVANQTAIALQNAYLFEEIQITLEETETLYNASRRIAAAGDLTEIVAAVAEEVQVPAINRATLWVAEQDAAGNVTSFFSAANWYRRKGTSPLTVPLGTRLSAEEFPATRMGMGSEAMFIDDIQEDERIDTLTKEMFTGQHIRAVALLPLRIGNRQIGTLMLTGEEPYHFSDREVRPYRSLAGQMAVTVESQRLLEETRRRAQELEAINDTGRVITSVLDPDVLIRQVVDTTKERFSHYYVGIILIEDDKLIFQDGSTIGRTEERLKYRGFVFDLDTPGVITDAARTGNPVLVPDVHATPRYIALPELAGTRSELAVPILAKGEVIGVLDVQSDRTFAYDQIDVLLLQSLASQVGVAVQNAQLFNEAEQTAWREQRAREIIARVQAAPDIESILQVAVRELGQALNTPRATVQLKTQPQPDQPARGDDSDDGKENVRHNEEERS